MTDNMESIISMMHQFRSLNLFALLPLTRQNYMVLFSIRCLQEKQPENLTVSAVANQMETMQPAVSRTLRGLEQQGMVVREVSRTDRRNTCVALTEEGTAALKEADEMLNTFQKGLSVRLEPEEFHQMQILLKKLYRAAAEQLEQMKKGAK